MLHTMRSLTRVTKSVAINRKKIPRAGFKLGIYIIVDT